MINFSDVKEETKKPGSRILPGVHHVKMTNIDLSTFESKEGKEVTKGTVRFECIKTLKGNDSVGKEIFFDIMFPTGDDETKQKNFLKRILHMFNKCKGTANVEKINEWFNTLNLSSITELVTELKTKFEGSEINLFVMGTKSDKDGKWYPQIPMFTSGVCECADVEETAMFYSEDKHGLKNQTVDTTKKENVAPTSDKLPWE